MNAKADAYYEALPAAVRETASTLRQAVIATGSLTEDFKWGHPIYVGGKEPVCLIKAASAHVTFGLWKGRRLLELESRLQPSGGGEMATMKLASPAEVDAHKLHAVITAALKSEEA